MLQQAHAQTDRDRPTRERENHGQDEGNDGTLRSRHAATLQALTRRKLQKTTGAIRREDVLRAARVLPRRLFHFIEGLLRVAHEIELRHRFSGFEQRLEVLKFHGVVV